MNIENLKEKLEYKDGKIYWKVRGGNQYMVPGKRAGSHAQKGYRHVTFDGRCYKEHHIVGALHYGYVPRMIDHINRNKSDNRIENLRETTPLANARNREYKLMTGIRRYCNKWRVKAQGHCSYHSCLGQAIKKRNEVCGI